MNSKVWCSGSTESTRSPVPIGKIGASEAERVITYCGGGIAATSDALVLTLLGHENVSVYDGSLSEWARDESLPMEVG